MYNLFEAVKTNVLGAHNIIEEAIKNYVHNVIALNTDKASAPITKFTSDKLFISANSYSGGSDIIFHKYFLRLSPIVISMIYFTVIFWIIYEGIFIDSFY